MNFLLWVKLNLLLCRYDKVWKKQEKQLLQLIKAFLNEDR